MTVPATPPASRKNWPACLLGGALTGAIASAPTVLLDLWVVDPYTPPSPPGLLGRLFRGARYVHAHSLPLTWRQKAHFILTYAPPPPPSPVLRHALITIAIMFPIAALSYIVCMRDPLARGTGKAASQRGGKIVKVILYIFGGISPHGGSCGEWGALLAAAAMLLLALASVYIAIVTFISAALATAIVRLIMRPPPPAASAA